jgi:hypothetical protein
MGWASLPASLKLRRAGRTGWGVADGVFQAGTAYTLQCKVCLSSSMRINWGCIIKKKGGQQSGRWGEGLISR